MGNVYRAQLKLQLLRKSPTLWCAPSGTVSCSPWQGSFFELLTHAHPVRGKLIPRRIVQGDPDPVFDYDSTLPVILDRVIAREYHKRPLLLAGDD